uniref:Uncharacterized protein n=1 Tax=Rhizophora mucronata TaxID=61149 RepID=A0A2P2J3S9_RHIMU
MWDVLYTKNDFYINMHTYMHAYKYISMLKIYTNICKYT